MWVSRLRRAVGEARAETEREQAVSERERATAEEQRALAAERGEEVTRLAAVRADLDEAARRERILRDSVQASFESVARNMHAMSMVQQQVLDGLGQYVSDARLMAEVMKADHAAAQMTRKAQTLLVMCGIWPARRETRPVTLFDCVRGAQSRILEFGRVEVHGGQTLHVVAPAVEGLMHTVAELLENATVFSPSRTQVAVSIREVAAGAVIEIDDAGLGMPPDVLEQALGQLREGLDLAQLGAVPRLGLACVGRWSRELGFGVELSTASAYGGARVVVFVPHRLLTEFTVGVPVSGAETVVVEPAAMAVDPLAVDNGATGPTEPDTPDPDLDTDLDPAPGTDTARPGGPAATGLPQRRNRRRTPPPRAAAPAAAPPAAVPPPATGATIATDGDKWTPEAARASVASVVAGTRRGRDEVARSLWTGSASGAGSGGGGRSENGGGERDRARVADHDRSPDREDQEDREGGR
ncbi:sensor histidine kinase [Streptomyces sp. NA02950]|nr:sensor histidine kinase [Streptomyces sp. NA02950]